MDASPDREYRRRSPSPVMGGGRGRSRSRSRSPPPSRIDGRMGGGGRGMSPARGGYEREMGYGRYVCGYGCEERGHGVVAATWTFEFLQNLSR